LFRTVLSPRPRYDRRMGNQHEVARLRLSVARDEVACEYLEMLLRAAVRALAVKRRELRDAKARPKR
jgi:hypothetical protein